MRLARLRKLRFCVTLRLPMLLFGPLCGYRGQMLVPSSVTFPPRFAHSIWVHFGLSSTACLEPAAFVALQRMWPESLMPIASVRMNPVPV
jgi:hypothetical protein